MDGRKSPEWCKGERPAQHRLHHPLELEEATPVDATSREVCVYYHSLLPSRCSMVVKHPALQSIQLQAGAPGTLSLLTRHTTRLRRAPALPCCSVPRSPRAPAPAVPPAPGASGRTKHHKGAVHSGRKPAHVMLTFLPALSLRSPGAREAADKK